jgi:hypothetical protein
MGKEAKREGGRKKAKAFNQLGQEVDSEYDREKVEMVNLLLSRDAVQQFQQDKIDKFTKLELIKQGQLLLAQVLINAAKALIAVAGKEIAKQALQKVIYDYNYMLGRQAAERLGNPKDLNSYLEKRCIKDLASYSMAPPLEFTERTKNRIVYRSKNCFFANAVRQFAEVFPKWADRDALEVAVSVCHPMDTGWANGFNADMKFKRIRYQLADLSGEGLAGGTCDFEMEVSE